MIRVLVAATLSWLATGVAAMAGGVSAAAEEIRAVMDGRWVGGESVEPGWLDRPSHRAVIHERSAGGPVQAAIGWKLDDPGTRALRGLVARIAVVIAFGVALASLLGDSTSSATGPPWRALAGVLGALFLGLLAAGEPGWLYGAGRFAQDALEAGVRPGGAVASRAVGAEVSAVLARERGVLEAVSRRAGVLADEQVGPVVADGLRSYASRLEADGARAGLTEEVALLARSGSEGRVSAGAIVLLEASRERAGAGGGVRLSASGRFPGSGSVPALAAALMPILDEALGGTSGKAWSPDRGSGVWDRARREIRDATLAHVDSLLVMPSIQAGLPRLAEDPFALGAWVEDRRGDPVDLGGDARRRATAVAEAADLLLRGVIPLTHVAAPGLLLEGLVAFAGLMVAWSLLPWGRRSSGWIARAWLGAVLVSPALALAARAGDGAAEALLGLVLPPPEEGFQRGREPWLLGALAAWVAAMQIGLSVAAIWIASRVVWMKSG